MNTGDAQENVWTVWFKLLPFTHILHSRRFPAGDALSQHEIKEESGTSTVHKRQNVMQK